MADSAGAPSTPSAPAASNSAPQGFESVGDSGESAEKRHSPAKPAQVEQKADENDKSAKPAKPVESDDDEFDVAGEKIKRKDWRELQDLKKRRQEFDRAAHTKMQEAAAERKSNAAKEAEFVRLANALKEDPWALHRGQGMTDEQLNQLAEQRLVAQMKRAQMTPEQVEAEQMRAELAELRGEKEKNEKTVKEQRQAELKQKYVAQYDKQIAEGMQKANLARTRETARKVASVMAKYAAIGESIDPYVAAQIVREDHHAEVRHELAELVKTNPRQALELLGPEVVAEIAKSQIQAAQQFQPQKQPQKQQAPQPTKQTAPLTFEEARKKLGIRGY